MVAMSREEREEWERSRNPYPGLFLETRPDGTEIWVFRGYEIRNEDGTPVTSRATVLHAYRMHGG